MYSFILRALCMIVSICIFSACGEDSKKQSTDEIRNEQTEEEIVAERPVVIAGSCGPPGQECSKIPIAQSQKTLFCKRDSLERALTRKSAEDSLTAADQEKLTQFDDAIANGYQISECIVTLGGEAVTYDVVLKIVTETGTQEITIVF